MFRSTIAASLAAAALAPLAEALPRLDFSDSPRLTIEDQGVVTVGEPQHFDVEFSSRNVTVILSDAQRAALTNPVVVVWLYELDDIRRIDADRIGIYEAPVDLLFDAALPGDRTRYRVRRSGAAPVGAISAAPGPWPRTLSGNTGPDPDPDSVQQLYIEARALRNAGSSANAATAIRLTQSRETPYFTVSGDTLISAEARAVLANDNPNRYIIRTSIVTDQKLNAPALLQIPIETDPPTIEIINASSSTVPDIFLDTSGATPTLMIENPVCDRTLALDLEFELPAPRGAVEDILFAFDTSSAVVTDITGAPVPLVPNPTSTTSLLQPADQPAGIDASSLSFTPVFGSTELIAQAEALPGAVVMTNDGLELNPRVTVELLASPPAGLIDPEILGAGTSGIAPDGSFTVDLIGDGDGFPPNAVARISVIGVDGRGDTAVILPLGAICPADLDGDGQVGSGDLGALLAAWGSCP